MPKGQQEPQTAASFNPMWIVAGLALVVVVMLGFWLFGQKSVQAPAVKQEQVAPAPTAPTAKAPEVAPATIERVTRQWMAPGVFKVTFKLSDFGVEFKIADLKKAGIDLTKDSKFAGVGEYVDPFMKESWKITNPEVMKDSRITIRGTHTLWGKGSLGDAVINGDEVQITVKTPYTAPGRHFITYVPQVFVKTTDGKLAGGWGDYPGHPDEESIVLNAHNQPQWGSWIDNDQKKIDPPGPEGLKIAKSRK